MKAPAVFRSLLYCPANEPRKVRRLSGSGADGVVLDLEDAVAADQKIAARASARAALPTLPGVLRTVRVNAFETGLTAGDVAAVVCSDLDAILLPKAETVEDVRRIDRLISKAEIANGAPPNSVGVICIIETCVAVDRAAEIARSSPRVLSLAFGTGDLGNDLGLLTLQGSMNAALAYGRAKIVYDARGAGLPAPLDGPYLNIRDSAGLADDCLLSRSLGHGGRVCLHPDQVPVVNQAFGPDPREVALARKVIQAFAEAEQNGSASILVDGVFVDYPIVYKAERIVALADAIAAKANTALSAQARQ